MPLTCDVILDAGVRFADIDPLAGLLRHAAQSEPLLSEGRWQMTLRLCDDLTIADLHGRFFGDPTPTDVITFPSDDAPGEDDTYLGDIIVSVEIAANQAVEAGHSAEREIAFLALHGLLHLCGHDDATDEQRAAMHERQYMVLDDWEREWGRPW